MELSEVRTCNWARLEIYKDPHPKFGVHVRQNVERPGAEVPAPNAHSRLGKSEGITTPPPLQSCASIATSAFIPPTTAPPNQRAPFCSPPQFGVVIVAWLSLLTPSLGTVVRRLDMMGWDGGKGVYFFKG
jgi:hypothetical protein